MISDMFAIHYDCFLPPHPISFPSSLFPLLPRHSLSTFMWFFFSVILDFNHNCLWIIYWILKGLLLNTQLKSTTICPPKIYQLLIVKQEVWLNELLLFHDWLLTGPILFRPSVSNCSDLTIFLGFPPELNNNNLLLKTPAYLNKQTNGK